MQKKNQRLLFIGLLLPFLSSAQKNFKVKETYTINISSKDTTLKAEVFYAPKTISAKKDLMYYWYTPNKIITTQGAYQGRLLNGEYNVFFNNTSNLKEKGNFENGTKTGEWLNWNNNSFIKESCHWKKGKLNGTFKSYDLSGHLIKEGKYRNNLLEGNLYEYLNGKVVKTLKYKKGVEINTGVTKASKTTTKPNQPTVKQQQNTIITTKKDSSTIQKQGLKKSNINPFKKKVQPVTTAPKTN